MNIFATPVGVKPRQAPTPQTTSNEDRLQQTALTTARAQAKKLCDLYKREPFDWDLLQKELSLATIPTSKLDYPTLLGFLQGWVNAAPSRQQKEALRLAEELALRERRTYTAVDIKLPNGLDFKPQQKKAIAALLDVLYNKNLSGSLVPLGTGKGKSWIAAGLALWLQKHDPGKFCNFLGLFPPILIITKKSVVLDFRETLKKLGLESVGLAVDVWSYNEVFSSKNRNFFREETVEVFGQQNKVIRFNLPAIAAPKLIILDECQEIKKEKSKRTKYLDAFLQFPEINWVFTSATPAVTVWDTMFMTLAMRLQYGARPITRETFPEFARTLSLGADPRQANAAALERWGAAIGDRFVKPPGDPQKVKALNKVKLFEITDPINKAMLKNAMKNYLEALERTGRSIDPQGQVMVAFMVMARAAELATVDTWVADAIHAHQNGYAPVIAIRFTETLKELVMKLSDSEYFKQHNLTKEKISLIWGGNREIKLEDLLPETKAAEIAAKMGMWILDNPDEARKPKAEDIGITKEEFRSFHKGIKYTSERIFREMTKDAFAQRNERLRTMKLHNQNQAERHENVQNFLNGATEFCIYTLSSGGTGISLDHRYMHTRPRKVMSTICFWAEEFAQALGRCVRITTITDTLQEIYIPENTMLSDHMAPKLAKKLRSIDAIGSSNVDLASELEDAIRKKKQVEKLTAEDLSPSESSGVIEVEEEEADDEETEDQVA
jgi:hypothetical protein